MTKVFVALCTTGWVHDHTVHMLRKIEKKYAGQVELVYPAQCVNRIFHDAARNAMVEEFLKTDCDVLWFLDSDVTPPENILDLITVHGEAWQLAGAPYPVLMIQGDDPIRQLVFTAYKGSDGKSMAPTHIPMEGTEWVDGVATGCMFIRRGVFMRLSRPWFEFGFDETTRAPKKGEDLGFCLKMRELGLKFFVDYALVCKHMKEMDLLEVNNYAMSYAKKSLETYRAALQEELRQHAAAIAAARQSAQPASKSSIWLPK